MREEGGGGGAGATGWNTGATVQQVGIFVHEVGMLVQQVNGDASAANWDAGSCNFDQNRGGQQGGMSQIDEDYFTMTFSSISIDRENSYLSDSRIMGCSEVPYYGIYNGYNIFDYHSPQMSYAIHMHADQQYPSSWVNQNYQIHGFVGGDQAAYTGYIINYIENYESDTSKLLHDYKHAIQVIGAAKGHTQGLSQGLYRGVQGCQLFI